MADLTKLGMEKFLAAGLPAHGYLCWHKNGSVEMCDPITKQVKVLGHVNPSGNPRTDRVIVNVQLQVGNKEVGLAFGERVDITYTKIDEEPTFSDPYPIEGQVLKGANPRLVVMDEIADFEPPSEAEIASALESIRRASDVRQDR